MDKKIVIAITGATGNMLSPCLKMLLEFSSDITVRILTRNPKRRDINALRKQYGDRFEIIKGDITDFNVLENFVKGVSYLVNAAAIIPPLAEHKIQLAAKVNKEGTENVVNALLRYNPDCKLIHISTVAIYGNRNYLHPFGRVGDPLLPSFFDMYGASKLKAERYVVESSLKHWAVIRQTGMLYSKLLMNNISDGLMFHTPFNVPIEWSSDIDSSRLILNIIKQDLNGECDDFWLNIYNLGGGEKMRVTGFETFDVGFRLIGGNAEKFLKPNYMATRNFHCFWFYDSDILEEKFHFRTETFDSFWTRALNENPLVSLGKFCPRGLIKVFVFKPLLKNKNAPLNWYFHKDDPKVIASWGGYEEFKKIPREWKEFPLLSHNQNPDNGEYLDYEALKDPRNATLLSHGWSEYLSHLDESEIKTACDERGLILKSQFDGDLHSLLTFECKSCGNEFKTTAFGLLFGGYGCPSCSEGNPWNFGKIADYPFYRQLYYDSMTEKEKNYIFYFDGEKECMKKQ